MRTTTKNNTPPAKVAPERAQAMLASAVNNAPVVASPSAAPDSLTLTSGMQLTHRVRCGDTLSGIAKERLGNALRWREIYDLNRDQIRNGNFLMPGMVLKLPSDGKQPAAAPATPAATAKPATPTPAAKPAAPTAPAQPAGRPSSAPVGGPGCYGDRTTVAQAQMERIQKIAKRHSGGRSPGGWCYKAVWDIICKSGYGKMPAELPPPAYRGYARQFAEYANKHLDELGLKKLPIDNPYDAPPGALVVVRAGTPGTAHPTAGDIVVAMGNGRFLNDGEMAYGGPQNFRPGNNYVLGVYVPA